MTTESTPDSAEARHALHPEEASEQESVMRIGEVAARTDLSLRSLRHWEEVGLITPTGRTEGGFRLYTDADVDKIMVIRRMKPLGFSLDQMRAVMSDIETLAAPDADAAAKDSARRGLTATQQEALERRQKLVQQLSMADEFIDLINGRLD